MPISEMAPLNFKLIPKHFSIFSRYASRNIEVLGRHGWR